MRLYIENNQSVICNTASRPKFNSREEWQCETALVDGKEIKFCYSYRFRNPLPHDDRFFNPFESFTGFYLYFQLDSQWYKMDAYQEVYYLGERCIDIVEYIEKKVLLLQIQ